MIHVNQGKAAPPPTTKSFSRRNWARLCPDYRALRAWQSPERRIPSAWTALPLRWPNPSY